MKYLLLLALSFIALSCSTKTCANERKYNPAGSAASKLDDKMTINRGDIKMNKVKVAKADGTLQCSQGKKIPLADMQKQLKNIHVFSSETLNDGMMRIQVCGSPTGSFNVYEISEADLEKALGFGFQKWTK